MPVGRGLVHRGSHPPKPPVGVGQQLQHGRRIGVHQVGAVGEGVGAQIDRDGLAQRGVGPLGGTQPQGDGLLDLAVPGQQPAEPLLGQLAVRVDDRGDRAAQQPFGFRALAELEGLVGLVDRRCGLDHGPRHVRGQGVQVHQLPGTRPRPRVLGGRPYGGAAFGVRAPAA